MMIRPYNKRVMSFRTGSIQNVTEKDITTKLGIKPIRYSKNEGDGKVTRQWVFTVDNEKFAIWDYKGSAKFNQFSFWGQRDVMGKIFGQANIDR